MCVTLLREALVYFYLQRSVPIQPKTSNNLPKFCQSTVVSWIAPLLAVELGGARVLSAAELSAARAHAAWARPRHVLSSTGRSYSKIGKNLANLWRARSRLYQNEVW